MQTMNNPCPLSYLTALAVLAIQVPGTAQKKGAKDAPPQKAAKTDAKPVKIDKVDGYEISIRTVKPQPIVSIRIQCKQSELSAQYGKYLPQLFGYAGQNKGQFAGQPLAIYHAFEKDGIVDVEMACPLKKPIKGKGEIKAGMLYGGRVAATYHLGAYHKLSNAHAAVQKWFKATKHKSGGAPWEVYISDPTLVKPSEVRTDLFFPLQQPKTKKVVKKTGKKVKVDK